MEILSELELEWLCMFSNQYISQHSKKWHMKAEYSHNINK